MTSAKKLVESLAFMVTEKLRFMFATLFKSIPASKSLTLALRRAIIEPSLSTEVEDPTMIAFASSFSILKFMLAMQGVFLGQDIESLELKAALGIAHQCDRHIHQ